MMIEKSTDASVPLKRLPGASGKLGLMRPHFGTLLRSTLIGYVVSVIPGHGATISSVVSYAFQKRISRQPETFGKGNPEGLIASESAANASVPGALVPMLALGIPGSASTAVLIGALTLHGVDPGPLLFSNDPQIPYSIFAAMLISMPIMVALGLTGARLWVRVTEVPKGAVAALVVALCLLGTYASENNIFAIWITVFFGIAGYLLRKVDIEPAPVVLALILGPIAESNFRRSLIASAGDPMTFFSHPISLVCLVLAVAVFLLPLLHPNRSAPAPV